MSTFDQDYQRALAAARPSPAWHPEFLQGFAGEGRRYGYTPFHKLSQADQRRARAAYPHKSTGGKYDFIDEHYLYPVKKDGTLGSGRGAHRMLAIPHAKILDDAFMASLGYTKNKGW